MLIITKTHFQIGRFPECGETRLWDSRFQSKAIRLLTIQQCLTRILQWRLVLSRPNIKITKSTHWCHFTAANASHYTIYNTCQPPSLFLQTADHGLLANRHGYAAYMVGICYYFRHWMHSSPQITSSHWGDIRQSHGSKCGVCSHTASIVEQWSCSTRRKMKGWAKIVLKTRQPC